MEIKLNKVKSFIYIKHLIIMYLHPPPKFFYEKNP